LTGAFPSRLKYSETKLLHKGGMFKIWLIVDLSCF
jgi:hypothetical protein